MSKIEYIKLKSLFEPVFSWNITNGVGNWDQALMLYVDDNENLYVTGAWDGGGPYFSARSFKYNILGDTVWFVSNSSAINHVIGSAIVVDSSNYMYVSGNYETDILLNKYDSNGNYIWGKTIDLGSYENFNDLKIDTEDNIYASGYHYVGPDRNITLFKFDSNGNKIWNLTLGTEFNESFSPVMDLFSDKLYVSAYYLNNSKFYSILNIYDTDGDLLINKFIEDFGIMSITISPNGYMFLAGFTNIATDYDIIIIKFDTYGNEIYRLTIDSTDNVQVVDIDTDYTGNVYYGSKFNLKPFFAKFDNSLNLIYNQTYDYISSGYIGDISVAESGNLYMIANRNSGNRDYITIKYSQE